MAPGTQTERVGDDIPVLGRILAVADAYSAMTLDRPYRKSMSAGEAKQELLSSAGTQLDPDLVKVFLGVLDAREDTACAAEDPETGEAVAG